MNAAISQAFSSVLSSRYLGLAATTLLLGFIGAIYALKPGQSASTMPLESARLQGAQHFRVVSDPLELAQANGVAGPAVGVVADAPPPGSLRDAPVTDTATPASLGLTAGPAAAGGGSPPAPRPESDPAIEELKDLGMATLSSPGGNWYTLQTAYIAVEDIDLLKRRVLEASNALGSRDGLFIYTAERGGRQYNGVCVRKFESGSDAKAFKGRLDKRLGYPSQVRSKKGLQKELGL